MCRVEYSEGLHDSSFPLLSTGSQPLSTCFRSDCTVSDIPHNRFCFPDRAFPFPFLFPNKNIKTKMVKVFYRRFRPLSSLDEGGGRAVGHALAVCRRCDFSGSGKDGCQVRHCLLTGASSRRGAEVGHYHTTQSTTSWSWEVDRRSDLRAREK